MDEREVAERFCIPQGAAHFEQALTHPSYTNERRRGGHYQRLEFLGDAVLQFCASEALYAAFPEAHEGELTRRRAQLVNADALAAFAKNNGVAEVLRLGRGAEATGLREGTNVLSDAVEALIAAAYLDAGLEAARTVCRRIVEAGLAQLDEHDGVDPKTRLQEGVQAAGGATPQYQLIETTGPSHEPSFRVLVSVNGRSMAEGVGRSKRTAERDAAARALAAGSWQAALNSGSERADEEVTHDAK